MRPGHRVTFTRLDTGEKAAGIVLRTEDAHNRRTVVLLDSGEVCAGFREDDLEHVYDADRELGSPEDVDPEVWIALAEEWGEPTASDYLARAKVLADAHAKADTIRIIDGPRRKSAALSCIATRSG